MKLTTKVVCLLPVSTSILVRSFRLSGFSFSKNDSMSVAKRLQRQRNNASLSVSFNSGKASYRESMHGSISVQDKNNQEKAKIKRGDTVMIGENEGKGKKKVEKMRTKDDQ